MSKSQLFYECKMIEKSRENRERSAKRERN